LLNGLPSSYIVTIVESGSDWRLDLCPADVAAHYAADGPVAAAVLWAGRVADGRLAEAWPATASLFRLALTRRWCWWRRDRLTADGHDPVLVAAALADDDGPAHPLWPAFARSQQPPEPPRPGGAGGRWVAAGPPEPVGPDLEVVELLPAETAGTDHHGPPLTLLLRMSRAGWLVAGHGRVPLRAGWPPCR
jgi:hypothetical protein